MEPLQGDKKHCVGLLGVCVTPCRHLLSSVAVQEKRYAVPLCPHRIHIQFLKDISQKVEMAEATDSQPSAQSPCVIAFQISLDVWGQIGKSS